MKILKNISLGIVLSLLALVLCDDDKAAEEAEEEKDPWDKSTDKYRHHTGSSHASNDSEEPVKIDVTEVSESEVHSGKSKICKDCKTNIVVQEAPNVVNSTKLKSTSGGQNFKKEIDEETKDQIKDATDEKDPADSVSKDTQSEVKHKKQSLERKQLNHKIGFYPGAVWEYPYPYYHPQYGCGGKQGPCTPEVKPHEAKEDKTKKSKAKHAKTVAVTPVIVDKKAKKKKENVEGKVFPKIKGFGGWMWKGPRVSEIGTSWGTPCWFNQEKKQFTCKQLVPSHYYGPPSAGWGGFQPGHTGSGWGTPYWYKKCTTPSKHCRQIIPSHYYGPPSAGWGGFQPGHTGGGWGTPYWYKKCAIPSKHCRQLIPVHYYGPPSAGWGGFQPGHTGAGWGTPYWYKKCATPLVACRQYINHPLYQPNRDSWFVYRPTESTSWIAPTQWYKIESEEARKHDIPSVALRRYEVTRHHPFETPNPSHNLFTRYNIAALHEWISYLQKEREKDRELERYRLRMKDREGQRRYNLELLHYNKNKRKGGRSSAETSSHVGSHPVSYFVTPHAKVQEVESPAVEYLLNNNSVDTLYND